MIIPNEINQISNNKNTMISLQNSTTEPKPPREYNNNDDVTINILPTPISEKIISKSNHDNNSNPITSPLPTIPNFASSIPSLLSPPSATTASVPFASASSSTTANQHNISLTTTPLSTNTTYHSRLLGFDLLEGLNSPSLDNLLSTSSMNTNNNRTPIQPPDTPVFISPNSNQSLNIFRQGSLTHSYLQKSLLNPLSSSSSNTRSKSLVSTDEIPTKETDNITTTTTMIPLATEETIRTPMNILLKREFLKENPLSSSSSVSFSLPIVPASESKIPFTSRSTNLQQIKESIAGSIPTFHPNISFDQINHARNILQTSMNNYEQYRTTNESNPLIDDIINQYTLYSDLLSTMLTHQMESAEQMKVAELDNAEKDWKLMNESHEQLSKLLATETEKCKNLEIEKNELTTNFENLVVYCEQEEKEKETLIKKIEDLEKEIEQYRTKVSIEPTEIEQQLLDATTALNEQRIQQETMEKRITDLLLTLSKRDNQINMLQTTINNHNIIHHSDIHNNQNTLTASQVPSSTEDLLFTYSPRSIIEGPDTTVKKNTDQHKVSSLNDSAVSPKGSSILINSFASFSYNQGSASAIFPITSRNALSLVKLLNEEINTLVNNDNINIETATTEKPTITLDTSLSSPSLPVTDILSPASTILSKQSTKSLQRTQELLDSLRQQIINITNERDTLQIRCDELNIQATTLQEATSASVCAVNNISLGTPYKSNESPTFSINGGLFSPSSFLSPSSATNARSAREATLAALSADNRKLNEKVVTLQAIVDSQAREVSRIASTLATTKATVLDYERKFETLNTENINSISTIDNLRKDNKDKDIIIHNLQEELNESSIKMEQLSHEINRKHTEITHLQTYMEKLENNSYQTIMNSIKGDITNNNNNTNTVANVIAAIPANSTSEYIVPKSETVFDSISNNEALANANKRIEQLEKEIGMYKYNEGIFTAPTTTSLAPMVVQKIINSNHETSNSTKELLPPTRSQSRGRPGLRRIVVRPTGDVEMEYENEEISNTSEYDSTNTIPDTTNNNNKLHYNINLSTSTGKSAWSSLSSNEANQQLHELATKLRNTSNNNNIYQSSINNYKSRSGSYQPPSTRSVSREHHHNYSRTSSTSSTLPMNERIPVLLHQTENQLAQDNIDGKPIDETLVQVRERLLYLLNKQTSSSITSSSRSTSVRPDQRINSINENTNKPNSIPSSSFSSSMEYANRPSLPVLNPLGSNSSTSTTTFSRCPSTLPTATLPSITKTDINSSSSIPSTSSMPQKPNRPLRANYSSQSINSNPVSNNYNMQPNVPEVSKNIPTFSTVSSTSSSSLSMSGISSPSSLSESILISKAIEEEKALRARVANNTNTAIPLNFEDDQIEWTDLLPNNNNK